MAMQSTVKNTEYYFQERFATDNSHHRIATESCCENQNIGAGVILKMFPGIPTRAEIRGEGYCRGNDQVRPQGGNDQCTGNSKGTVQRYLELRLFMYMTPPHSFRQPFGETQNGIVTQ